MTAPTITEFIAAHLARIEQTAREATPRPWEIDRTRSDCEVWAPSGVVAGTINGRDAAHVALHDPAQVLAWVAGIRAVVERCTDDAAKCPEDDWGGGDVMQAAVADYARHILRLVAAIFADQPGYNEEWRA